MSNTAMDMGLTEAAHRIVYLEQILDKLMEIVAITGSPEQLNALADANSKWSVEIKKEAWNEQAIKSPN